LWNEIGFNKFHSNADSIESALKSMSQWFPFNKGGEFRKWYGNNEYVIRFDEKGFNLLSNSGNNLPSKNLYFKEALTWTAISSSNLSVRLHPKGAIFSNAGMICMPNEKDFSIIFGLLNSNVTSKIISVLSPTLNFNAGDIKRIPVLKNKHNDVIELVSQALRISTEEWNSREMSWSFKLNELIKHRTQELCESYDLYKQYWKNKFFQLHQSEEELNRQFIKIYDLQDELASDVRLEEITILKEETSIKNGELGFHSDEVFAQFVSYAVGCMFGRYSLDKEGLILANQGETLTDFIENVGKSQKELLFIPDEDNIIPILDDEWFEDDIVARFYAYLRASFGEKEFQKNLDFVEECLGKDIRKYFVKDFYHDHIKRYKKRPIYWLFSSPKGSFNVLIYLHRYTPDTLNKILNSYLREFIEKLSLQRRQLEHTEVNGTPSEQSKARKEIDKIDIKIADCKKYESEILYPLASERIALDLDDGVLVNYNKLGAAVATVAGLNDKVAKKKVREFDWIDTTQIR
jgi:hypothetical protein